MTESSIRAAGPAPAAPRNLIMLTSRLGMGGAERHSITLANLLNKRYGIAAVYLKREEDMIGQLDQKAMLEVRCLDVSKRIDIRAIRELAEIIDHHQAGIVVCANGFALLYAQLARAYTKAPVSVVEIFHTTKLRNLKEHFELVVYRPFFWLANHLVFVCEAQKTYWLRRALWGRIVNMIYNGVDLRRYDLANYDTRYSEVRNKYGFTVDDRVVGICAVLRREKEHKDLIDAVARLRDAGQRWKLLIVGDGAMRESLEQQIARLGLQDDVKITGFQSDVRPYLAICDAVALVSTAETFSIAALEAMSMGKPMIMSDVGGATEQVTDGVDGFVFPAGDVAALTECLRRCWDRPRTQEMGRKARLRVETRFSEQKMMNDYIELFDGIYERRGTTENAPVNR
jgi:glycosyltransferase involved in cell wall biosynthesis